jgi:hypothetical protein
VGADHAARRAPDTPPRAKQPPAPTTGVPDGEHWVLGLQRRAGNAAVTALLDRGPAAPVRRAPDIATAASFTVPASLSGAEQDQVVTDRDSCRRALLLVSLGLDERAGDLDPAGEAALHNMARLTRAEAAKLAGPGPLAAADAGYLNGFLALTASGEKQAFQAAVQRLLDLFEQAEPTPADRAQLEALEDDLAEALHQRFIAHEEDELRKLVDLTGKVKSWNAKVGEYAGKVADHAKHAGDIRGVDDVAARAKQLKELSKSLGEKLGTAKEILEVANDLATIAGAQGRPDGTAMMQGIGQFAAGIDLVDKSMGRFAKAVPLLGELWSKYYKPLVDGCIKGLTKLAGIMEVKDRSDVVAMWNIDETGGMLERDANGAPIIPKLYVAKGIFPGGQPVFSYLWCLREGRDAPPMSEAVKVFFLDRRDIMNQIASTKSDELSSDWQLFSPSTWGSSGRATNLETWLPGHWQTVWSMLYGEYGRWVPH